MQNPVAKIFLNNISHNIAQIKQQVKSAKILAIIKADAYGHGAVKIAQYLEQDTNIEAFGVSRFNEARDLFEQGIIKPILLLEGVNEVEQLITSVQCGFWLVVQHLEQLQMIAKTKLAKPIKLWLKFDTGMHRLGLEPDDSKSIFKNLNDLVGLGKIHQNYVIMSHLACADDMGNNATILQLEKFDSLANPHAQYSLSNSAGIFGWPTTHYDWVRPGISMYGSSPLLQMDKDALNLKPSMELLTQVISTRAVKKGESIGYGSIWRAAKDTNVAIIACGYADCYPRVLQNKCYVWLNNRLCEIVGRVSMDTMAIDCSGFTHSENIKIGDAVELWGSNICIDRVAKDCGTISNELYCRMTSRVEKLYV